MARRPARRVQQGLDPINEPLNKSADVSTVMSDMMGLDNPMIQRARTAGKQQANRRGMLSSSMAAAAAEGAVVDRLTPLALQESGHRFSAQQAERDFGNTMALQDDDQEFRSGEAALDRDLQVGLQDDDQEFRGGESAADRTLQRDLQASDQAQQLRLSEQEFQQASALSDQEFEQTMGLTREEYAQRLQLQESDQRFQGKVAQFDARQAQRLQDDRIAAERDLQGRELRLRNAQDIRADERERDLAQLDQDTRRMVERMDRDTQITIAEMEVANNERRGAEDTIVEMQTRYQESLRSILQNPDLSAEERTAMIDSAQDMLVLQTRMVEDLYSIDIDWPDELSSSGTSAPGASQDSPDTPSAPPPPTDFSRPGSIRSSADWLASRQGQ